MQCVYGVIVFLFGAAIGSFINVIADRFNTGLSFLKGRSVCFSCNHELENRDLFPIFSFLFLKGRCRYCGSKIPASAFWIEVVMGIFTVILALKTGILNDLQFSVPDPQAILAFLVLDLIFATVLLISIYDLRHFIIPDYFLLALAILAFIHHLIFGLSVFFVLAGVALTLPFFLLFLFSKGAWFGFGDVKYILTLGFFLGFSQGLSAVVLAFWIGAAFSLSAIILKKIAPHFNLLNLKNNLTMKSEIPFGPFLSIGIIISFYLNADLFQLHELFF